MNESDFDFLMCVANEGWRQAAAYIQWARPKSCNRHKDCDAAEARLIAKGKNPPFINFHCHDDCCEECFGN